MISFTATLQRFGEMGEKTGWTYILISSKLAEKLKPNNKQSFRVKGKLDNFSISKVALMPLGDGNFIMPVNATMRKGIRKQKGSTVKVQLEIDGEPLKPPAEFIECLNDEPAALKHYNSLAGSHKNYFTRWIDSAKTDATKAKRIALAVNALAKSHGFGELMRAMKKDKEELF